jgi:TRAP-type C4-dicarboxylate transport system permease small subunit
MKRPDSLLGSVAALALFSMMLLTFADVIGRKFFGHSLTGAVELTELFMLVMIFFALPLASMAGEHIVFDLLDRVLPPAVLQWQKCLSHGLTALVFSGAAWIVLVRAQRTAEFGDTTSALEIRLAPFHYLVALQLAVTALVHAWLVWRDASGRNGRNGGSA